MNKIFMEIFST